ncbi:NUDIX hydrolase [Chelatococcus reniformis]|uniref:Nudix hydrolase domain-containing protein n=1 Tax=Chelatococcus reniformis TaxID=1494448 RepID=A0A916USV0_9HYPH|nr:NUDIX hydrolase [Chelatococcus reniformis]GGC86221.1 hypothetical protein GCM10010994_50150 [Chelatococcus reniformis]
MAKGKAVRIQYGALPYRVRKDASLELLLITSRDTKRWIIPKGWPMKGLPPARVAAREAFEEAGVKGRIDPKSIGRFVYEKRLGESGLVVPCEVTVFALAVRRDLKSWPEADEREARWTSPAVAHELLDDEGLKVLVARFADQHVGTSKRSAKVPRDRAASRDGKQAPRSQDAGESSFDQASVPDQEGAPPASTDQAPEAPRTMSVRAAGSPSATAPSRPPAARAKAD